MAAKTERHIKVSRIKTYPPDEFKRRALAGFCCGVALASVFWIVVGALLLAAHGL